MRRELFDVKKSSKVMILGVSEISSLTSKNSGNLFFQLLSIFKKTSGWHLSSCLNYTKRQADDNGCQRGKLALFVMEIKKSIVAVQWYFVLECILCLRRETYFKLVLHRRQVSSSSPSQFPINSYSSNFELIQLFVCASCKGCNTNVN